ncbi:MAG TPA: hypothetical protein PK370_02160 [Candidatus Woesebacteria bacterium]|nr:hypothetical protein [Candidatus Woesebacteria bacterium]HPJ16899.1 hypothetical protein [Candidatus Woesebacteria bacterium]
MDNQQPNAATLLNIENLIKSHDIKLNTLSDELKVQKEMLNDVLENDTAFQEASKEAKKFAKQKTVAKAQVIARPEVKTIVEKIKDIQSQTKELKVALSDYLAQYVTISGINQIEGEDGILRQIVMSAHLVKKAE